MIKGSSGLTPSDFKLARKYAVQFLYQQDINQQFFLHDATLNNFVIQSNVAENQKEFLKFFLEEILKSIEKIDSLIEKYSKNWKISRIAKVDLAVLRVAITELIERVETDIPVIISEATAIAQEYGSANSPLFINGILDAVAKEIRKGL